MRITTNIMSDMIHEQGWNIHKEPIIKTHTYKGVRLFFKGCMTDPDYLYVVDEAFAKNVPSLYPDVNFCLVCDKPADYDGYSYVVEAPGNLFAFFSALSQRIEVIQDWDTALTEIFLSQGSMQDILDISYPIFRNPCLIEDQHFNLLASCGQISESDNPYFYQTLKNGHPPTEFLEKLFSLPPEKKSLYTSRYTISSANVFSKYKELMANCIVDGATILRFGMLCIQHDSDGLCDLVTHLMDRMTYSPLIQKELGSSINSTDYLFSKIIDHPQENLTKRSLSSLGLLNKNRFINVALELINEPNELVSIRNRLETLFPLCHFFKYNNTAFILISVFDEKSDSNDHLKQTLEQLLHHLKKMNARYGVSFSFTDLHNLRTACEQASYALSHQAKNFDEKQTNYFYHMPKHIVSTFFENHDINAYCPYNILQLFQDDKAKSDSNADLLYTYIENDCNATTTSRLLHMHRNNIIYKINRIQEKYRFCLEDASFKLLFCLLYIAQKEFVEPSSEL